MEEDPDAEFRTSKGTVQSTIVKGYIEASPFILG